MRDREVSDKTIGGRLGLDLTFDSMCALYSNISTANIILFTSRKNQQRSMPRQLIVSVLLCISASVCHANEGAGLVGIPSGGFQLFLLAIILGFMILFLPKGWSFLLVSIPSYLVFAYILVMFSISAQSDTLLNIAIYSPAVLVIAQVLFIIDVANKPEQAPSTSQSNAAKHQNLASNTTLVYDSQAIEIAEAAQSPIELTAILEVPDIRKFLAIASKNRIISAQADNAEVCRFFNAIRYGEVAKVRQILSNNPLLILTKDVCGNTAITVAENENNVELLAFFRACLAK